MLPLGTIDRRTGAAASPSRFLAGLPQTAGLTGFQGRVLTARPYPGRSPAPLTAAPGRPAAKADFLTVLSAGQRVSHPIYGSGLVAEILGPRAVIDFDLFGKKNVIIEYAKLVKI
jgi:hypothetical protein